MIPPRLHVSQNDFTKHPHCDKKAIIDRVHLGYYYAVFPHIVYTTNALYSYISTVLSTLKVN